MKELEKIVDSNGEPLEIVDAEAREDIREIKQSLSDLTTFEKTASGAIVTFDDGSDLPMPKLEVAIEPQQDLHGYDSPWVGGAGKNKLQVTATTQTISGVTFTVNSDGTITLNGTSTTDVYFRLSVNMDLQISESIKYSATSTNNTLFKSFGFDKKDSSIQDTSSASFGSDITVNNPNNMNICWIHLKKGVSYSKVIVYPMIRLASVTDATFAPYSNICPISGWDEANVTRCGVNIWDEEWEVGAISNSNGGNYALAERVRSKNYISVKPNTPYYLYLPNTYSSVRIACYDKDRTYLGQATGWLSVNNNTAFTTPSNTFYIRFVVVKTDETYNNDISINYPSTDTSYHAYNGHTYTIDLDGTRYGGELDVVSGVLTITNGYIASYNGETIPSIWISDRDVYAEGTTPTVGAEVVYKLATPQTVQLTPTQVKSLLGVNNIWADTGNIELTYLTNNPLTQTVYDMVKILVEQST